IVAARTGASGTDVVVVRRGRLAGTARLPRPLDDRDVLDAAATLDLPGAPEGCTSNDTEEVGLVLAWLDGPGVRLVAASGWSEPAAGGRALAEVAGEARRAQRQLRRDRQLLTG